VSLVETLGVEIGVRTAGSPEAARAAEAIADALRETRLEPHFQEFPLLGYDAEEPEVEIDGERWAAGPCMYAHPTDGFVEGRVRHIATSRPDGLFPPAHSFAVEDADGRELARLEMTPFGGPAIPFIVGPRQVLIGPTAFISGADAQRLVERESATARVRIGGRFVPGRTERNVVAVLPGASEETIVVSAHYDSVWRGPGTIDNATGVEGVRRLAERFAAEPGRPRSIAFCAFAAEEIGLLGARRFVSEASLRGELDRIVGVVNLDCIAHGERLCVLASPPDVLGRAQALAESLGLTERYETEFTTTARGVDSVPFAEEGVPAASILHFPYPEYHLPSERLELVDERRLADSVDLAAALVESQLEDPVARPK
jgi:Iap family predicted aminopeptidase